MADYFSRSPMELLNHHGGSRQSYLAEQHINFVSSTAAPRAVKVDELIEATRNDEVLQTIIQLVQNGREDKSKALEPYLSNKHELPVTPNGLLLRDSRIVVPSLLRHTMVRIAHEGHQGFVKTAKLVAERVWFPGMRKMVDDLIASCPECQLTRGGNNPQPLKMTNSRTFPRSHRRPRSTARACHRVQASNQPRRRSDAVQAERPLCTEANATRVSERPEEVARAEDHPRVQFAVFVANSARS